MRIARFFLAVALALGAFSVAARAGTTGSLTGVVLDVKTLRPIAGAIVSASSPSQNVKATTDASGRFTFISLAPDSYTVGLTKEGYDALVTSGIGIFADQSQSVELRMQPSLKSIGRISARSSLDLVKPGTTGDVYSADSALTAAAAPAGGGGGLNNAYSAIAVLPGAFVPSGQMGVNQTVYIRGGYYDQIGYEYDGVPVNRSFDNYPGHSASTLGQQELQVYTGGGGAGASATGLAGFINQVVRSGTFPGFGDFSARVGDPTFYHDLSAEIGGATNDRRFTYYVGASGYNQDFRYFDNSNGAGLTNLFPNPSGPSNKTTYLDFQPGVYPKCSAKLTSPFDDANGDLLPTAPPFTYDPGCFATLNPVYGNVSATDGREVVGNFHFALPHHGDDGRDDIQLLYTNSFQYRQDYSGPGDAGSDIVNSSAYGGAQWPDYVTYPAGTTFLEPATIPAVAYSFPGSPQNRCYNTPVPVAGTCTGAPSALPSNYTDGRTDSASIIKLQYQKNIGDRAYVRLFGYTFYSNTDRSGASRRGIGSGLGAEDYDYEVDTHTRGIELQFADQLTDRNQLTGWLNYTTASTLRDNNFNYYNTDSQQVSNLTNGKQCFAAYDGTAANGVDSFTAGQVAPCNDPITQGFFGTPTSIDPNTGNAFAQNCSARGGVALPAAACAKNAAWLLTYTGNQGGLNTVRPNITSGAINDEWKPSDKLTFNFGLRVEQDEYDLANTNTPGKNFWFAAAQKEYCYNPVTLNPVFVPEPPSSGLQNQIPYVTFNCPIDASSGTNVQTVHPDGLDGHLLLSNVYSPTLSSSYGLPRLGATYSIDRNTVLRLSAGRYAQQPQAYEVQYNSSEENLANQLIGFFPYGFTTPRHDAMPQYSNNYDFSIEHRFKGDVSVKLTPYYRYATNQLYNATVYGQSPAFNSGTERSQGVEFELVKGDFKRDGFSALFSYTYLNSQEKWANYQNTNRNPVDPYNDEIQQYNAVTKSGGGARCYAQVEQTTPTSPSYVADPTCASVGGNPAILNPYYNSAPQPLFDKNGWYDTGLDFPYLSPNVFAVLVNYKHAKFSITPVVTLNEGATYGNPGDVIGLDPRTCSQNQGGAGFTTGNPLNADYTSCGFAATPSGYLYVPNPESGHFDGFGEYRQPWQLNGGLQVSYDFTPKARLNLTVANLFNSCFGGSSTPWSKAFAPSSNVCGYESNTFYVNNFYEGKSPNDVAANGVPLNPYFAHSFVPAYGDVNSYNYPLPLNIYLQLQVKL